MSNAGVCNGEIVAEASERVLKQVVELYEKGLGGGAPGSLGLKAIADHPLVNLSKQIRKPRKKISVMIIGNHSAGKSSFINWYIGEQVCKTGVAIETRGFIFITQGRKRETLTGDATVRYFDYLEDFASFEGILPNLFTEVSNSTERSFYAVDFVDTPGLVDGDMKYPFPVRDTIMWMADHVDLILVFFDPIGQATCKRTMEVVEQLNHGAHVEKISYFMSKADEVERESDRQRVLIQITQNLATRIRNSHAFNLPTFYLPHDDDLPCTIPNAIDDVCQQIDQVVHQTVQRVLRQLRDDCMTITTAIQSAVARDHQHRVVNSARTNKALTLAFMGCLATCLLLAVVGSRTAGVVCPSINGAYADACDWASVQMLRRQDVLLGSQFNAIAAGCIGLVMLLFGGARMAWQHERVLSRQERKKLDTFEAYVKAVAAQGEVLWEEYFRTLAFGAR